MCQYVGSFLAVFLSLITSTCGLGKCLKTSLFCTQVCIFRSPDTSTGTARLPWIKPPFEGQVPSLDRMPAGISSPSLAPIAGRTTPTVSTPQPLTISVQTTAISSTQRTARASTQKPSTLFTQTSAADSAPTSAAVHTEAPTTFKIPTASTESAKSTAALGTPKHSTLRAQIAATVSTGTETTTKATVSSQTAAEVSVQQLAATSAQTTATVMAQTAATELAKVPATAKIQSASTESALNTRKPSTVKEQMSVTLTSDVQTPAAPQAATEVSALPPATERARSTVRPQTSTIMSALTSAIVSAQTPASVSGRASATISARPLPTVKARTPGTIPKRRLEAPGPVFNSRTITGQEAMSLFPGLFKKKFFGGPTRTDGDLHCPTHKFLVLAPTNMTNIQNQMRHIIHFESVGIFQYVGKGTCGRPSTHNCSGMCLQEMSITYLMVWNDNGNPNAPWVFDAFDVESYCSCKNIG